MSMVVPDDQTWAEDFFRLIFLRAAILLRTQGEFWGSGNFFGAPGMNHNELTQGCSEITEGPEQGVPLISTL